MMAVIGLLVIALVVGFYILRQQRLAVPWDDRYTISAELSSGQALTPGQGQDVTVAGVEVGEIAKVTLRDGRALVEMSIDRGKLAQDRVRTDASLLIRPRTPLQDMTVDVNPGSARAPALGEDAVIPVSQTTPQVNLDEILAALEVDTRRWAVNLVAGFADGVRDQGTALRAALKASAPSLALTRRVTSATADRRRQLARAIHSLRRLTTAVADDERSLGTLVTAGETTFSTLASQDDALRDGLARLPGTLRSARSALRAARPFAADAEPALQRLIPVARTLGGNDGVLRALDGLQRDGLPALRTLTAIAPQTRRVAKTLAPTARRLARATPDLESSLASLDRLGDVFAYNPDGPQEGYLYWLAWFLHNGHSFTSGHDGNGPFWRGIVQFSCSAAINEALTGAILQPIIAASGACPTIPGGGAATKRGAR
jgi:phospholipid/cholesterol/gamma-HCH transport system substrate-binding protein